MAYRILAIIATLAMAVTTAFAETKEMEAYWRESGFSFQDIEIMFDDEFCYSAPNTALGCYVGLKALAKPLQRDIHVVNGELRIVRVFGDADKEPEKKKINDIIEFKKSIKKEAEMNKAKALELLHSYYKNGSRLQNQTFQRAYVELVTAAQKSGENMSALAATVINESLSSTYDPHTYVTPLAYMESQSNSSAEEFVGIGATVQELSGNLVLVPMPGLAAEKSGVKAGDVLIGVDGKETAGMKPSAAVQLIRGREGETVRLRLLRRGEPVDIKIVRAKVEIKNVDGEILRIENKKWGYVSLNSFVSEKACDEVRDQIVGLQKGGAQGLIFDLRNNGGGRVDGAMCIANLFLDKNKLIYETRFLGQENKRDKVFTEKKNLTSLPLVVLINAASASASELVAGALQDHHRAWVVGERSFGKGSMQGGQYFESNQKVLLFSTFALFHQPSGRSNQLHGIHPNFEVPVRPDATQEERTFIREADLYPNAIFNAADEWRETRSSDVRRIEKCMNTNSFDAEAKSRSTPGRSGDYQILKAAEVLMCS